MREITLEELLSAGCHFGHQVTRQNPKARDFVFEARDNIHIIDLVKTKEGLEAATAFIKALAAKEGSTLLVVATKRQAQSIVKEELQKVFDQLTSKDKENESPYFQSGLFVIANHWVGGTLTNSFEVSKNYKKLKDFESRLKSAEEKAKYTKKEVGQWEKEAQKLEVLYGGIKDMKKLPDAIFVTDTHLEELAVKEAYRMGIAVVGIVDTNADPTFVNYPIPANDDAVGSIKLITAHIMDAWIEGKIDQRSSIRQAQDKDQNQETKESEVQTEEKSLGEKIKDKNKIGEKEVKKKTVKKASIKKSKPKKEKEEKKNA